MDTQKRFLELDSLRGIAALGVVLSHYASPFGLLYHVFDLGALGVELFFMISGFVIFLKIERSGSYKDFIVSRIIRLYPAYWFAVTFTTIGIISWKLLAKQPLVHPNLVDYLANLTMFQHFFNIRDIDGVYWTLCIEWLFYLFITLLLITRSAGRIQIINFAVILCCLVNRLILKEYAPGLHQGIKNVLPIISYFPLFAAGITFYKIRMGGFNYAHVLMLIFCFVTQMVCYTEDRHRAYGMIDEQVYIITLAVFFAMFILYVIGKLGFIVNKPLLFLGKISYSLYLIHSHLIYTFVLPFLTNSRYLHIHPAIAVFFIAFPLAVLAAAIIHQLVEVPAMRYLKVKWQKEPNT